MQTANPTTAERQRVINHAVGIYRADGAAHRFGTTLEAYVLGELIAAGHRDPLTEGGRTELVAHSMPRPSRATGSATRPDRRAVINQALADYRNDHAAQRFGTPVDAYVQGELCAVGHRDPLTEGERTELVAHSLPVPSHNAR